ncbi:MAG TPA: hypothetical protein VKY19_05255 [Ktedonosporobacter sp.]|nr:hypothetical protein [Ktedonosporobacter sp.]
MQQHAKARSVAMFITDGEETLAHQYVINADNSDTAAEMIQLITRYLLLTEAIGNFSAESEIFAGWSRVLASVCKPGDRLLEEIFLSPHPQGTNIGSSQQMMAYDMSLAQIQALLRACSLAADATGTLNIADETFGQFVRKKE